MDRLDAFRTIATQATRGDMVFPTNVSASLKIQQALNEPDCHMELAAKLVTTEPLLAARTVAIANSAAYNRTGMEITNIRAAVMRLGFRTLQSLVAAVVVRQIGSAISDPMLREKATLLWEHTAHVAALSFVIARKVTRVDPETALFAGIVHEVGAFYLLSRADEFPGLLEGDSEAWAEYGEKLIGRGVLKKLAVPQPVSDAVESVWYGYRAIPPETLGDTLVLANELSPVPSPLQYSANTAVSASVSSLDFVAGGGILSEILEESAEEVRALTDALLF